MGSPFSESLIWPRVTGKQSHRTRATPRIWLPALAASVVGRRLSPLRQPCPRPPRCDAVWIADSASMCPARHTTREAPRAEQARSEARKSSRDEIRKVASLLKNNHCRAAFTGIEFADSKAGRQDLLSCPQFVGHVRVTSVEPPPDAAPGVKARHFIEIFVWEARRGVLASSLRWDIYEVRDKLILFFQPVEDLI